VERLSIRIMSIVAFVIVLITDVAYILLVDAQGPSPQPYIARFVAAYIAVMTALIAISMLSRPEIVRIRVAMRAAAAGGLFMLGFLAAFTIGPPLVIAGFLVLLALTRTARETRSRPAKLSGLVAAAVAAAVLLGGLEVAQRVVVCPEKGQAAGGGSGLITGPYQYECVDGVAHYHSG
jgi:MFS family permease